MYNYAFVRFQESILLVAPTIVFLLAEVLRTKNAWAEPDILENLVPIYLKKIGCHVTDRMYVGTFVPQYLEK